MDNEKALFPKKKRVVDEEALNWARLRPCEACGKPPPSDPDHIVTRGAGGGDTKENLLSLCRAPCHIERHTIGLRAFVKKYNLPVSWNTRFPKRTDI